MNKIDYNHIMNNEIEKFTHRPTLLLHACCGPCSSSVLERLREFFDITIFFYNPNIDSDFEFLKRQNEEIRLVEELNKELDYCDKIFIKNNENFAENNTNNSKNNEKNVKFDEKNNIKLVVNNQNLSKFDENSIKISENNDETLKNKCNNDKIYEQNSNVKNFGKIKIITTSHQSQDYEKVVLGFENEKEGGKRCKKCFELRLEKTAKFAKERGYDWFSTTLSVSPHKNAQKLNEIGLEISKKIGINFLVADFKKQDGYKKSIELSKKYNLYRQNYCGCKFSKNQINNN